MSNLYIFIMIVVLILVYGILFRMKNKEIITLVENFDTNLTGVEKINKNALPTLANGNWTSLSSEVTGDNVTDTIRFNIKNDYTGSLVYKGVTFDIQSVDENSNILTKDANVEGSNRKYLLNPNPIIKSYRLPITLPANVPVMEMIPKIPNTTEKKALIFKYMNGKLNPHIIKLIEYGQNKSDAGGTFFSKPSIDLIKKYKFNYEAVKGIYAPKSSFSKDDQTKIARLKEVYNNTISIQLIRQFIFSNSESQFTPYSRVYNIEFEKDGQILKQLEFRRLKEELNENKLAEKFYNIKSYAFLHKNSNFETSYDYSGSDILFGKNDLKLDQNSDKYFSNSLTAPNLPTVTKEMNSEFTPTFIAVLYNYDKNNITNSINVVNKKEIFSLL